MDINKFRLCPIMGILRGAGTETIEPLAECAASSGLGALEIAMNTPEAPLLIRRLKKAAKGRLDIGAGTVLTTDELLAALEAGASFIVLPVLVRDVVEYCVKKSVPVFPGALTPLEIYNAWSAGATMVKVFPAKFFGPAYIREIKGPFGDIELLACGGVTPDNIRLFFEAGASAAAFGAGVFKKDLLAAGDFKRIGESIKKIIAGYKNDRAVL